eukprot:4523570-Amphidinium_carterae.2
MATDIGPRPCIGLRLLAGISQQQQQIKGVLQCVHQMVSQDSKSCNPHAIKVERLCTLHCWWLFKEFAMAPALFDPRCPDWPR